MEACEEVCECNPCRCVECPKIMRAQLSVSSRNFDPTDGDVVGLLSSVPGVESAKASLLKNVAEVVYDSERIAHPQALVDALASGGFRGSLRRSWLAAAGAKLATLRVGGMTCTACSSSVEAALLAVPGVRGASVSVVLGEARVEYDPALATEDQLVGAVEDAGFDAALSGQREASNVALRVGGMSCSACAAGVEGILKSMPGVLEASVDFLSGRAEVWFDPSKAGPRSLIQALDEAGYPAEPCVEGIDDGSAMREREKEYWRRKFLVSLAFSLPLMIVSMGLMYVPAAMEVLDRGVGGLKLMDLACLLLATPVQFWVGRGFHSGALRALRMRRANMDVLVSVGTNAAYFASIAFMVYSAVYPAYEAAGNFFETSAFLICFICLGKYLESLAKGKTSQAISELLKLAPTTAILCTADGNGQVVREEELPASLIQQGDLLKVLPGARVPADGRVVAGSSHADESMITGEPLPVAKRPGDELIGGTVNGGGVLLMQAGQVGADTALAQIVRLVENAQMSKAPIQAYADRLSAIFVPTVLALAVAVFAGWYITGIAGLYPPSWLPPGIGTLVFSLTFGISVVVIACPCALGLALPTALMVGTGVGASYGVLIKSAEALERAQALQVVVFDKTGTLTQGRPAVVAVHQANKELPLDSVLLLAASAEAGSEHPLAQAVLSYAAGTLGLGAPEQTKQAQQQQGAQQQGEGGRGALPAPAVAPTLNGSSGEGASKAFGEKANGYQGWPADELRQPLLQNGHGEESERLAAPPNQSSAPASASKGSTGDSSSGGRSVEWVLPTLRMERVDGAGLRCTLRAPPALLQRLGAPLDSGASEGSGALGVGSPGHARHRAGQQAQQQQAQQQQAQQQQQQQQTQQEEEGGEDAGQEVIVALGNRRLMQQQGIAIDPQTEEWVRAGEALGRTNVLVAVQGSLAAVLAIADPIKPEAPSVVAALRAWGLRTVMLTGDSWATARAVAAQLGVPRVIAEVMPAGKAEQIRRMQESEGVVVAMVGDGVNDSPAMAQADVSVAIGSGTAIAVEAADYVLVRSNLGDILTALDLSHATFACIRRNYGWALGYNLSMIPIAAGALYPTPLRLQLPPWLAGAAMAFSSLSVVASSLLLRRYRPPPAAAAAAGTLRGVTVAH